MTRTIQVSLGRITHKSFGKEDPFGVILRGLKGKNIVSTKSFLYHLKNVFAYSKSDFEVIYGELYKSKLSSKHQVLDKTNLTYGPEIIDEFFSVSQFVIFRDLSIVFTSSSKLRDDNFIEMIEILYSLNSEELFSQIEVHYRKEDFDIFKKIESFSRMIEVELINIRKSNPTPRPTFEKIEAFLSRERTDVLNAKFKSETSDGLARDLESHIMSGISISDSGYGDSIITGQKQNGDFETIRLKDKVIRKRIQYLPLEEKEQFINLIIEMFGKYVSSEDDLIHD
ncbi:MAG: hypothetical protein SCH66_10230 [Methanolobus sp.]|nr:hypothetical protein [Methanolobus sp.]